MKNYKNCIEMQAENMSKYLEESVVNSAGWISWNLQLKIRAQTGKSFKSFLFFTIYRKNFKYLKIFTPFPIVLTVSNHFGPFLT